MVYVTPLLVSFRNCRTSLGHAGEPYYTNPEKPSSVTNKGTCVECRLLTLVYKVLNGNGPEYLRDFLEPLRANRSLCSVSPYMITLNNLWLVVA